MILIHNAQIIEYINSTFETTIVKSHLLSILNILYFNLYNVSFESINAVERNKMIKTYLGGCIRTENVLERKIIFLKISNVYSDETTVGIKIIDIQTGIDSLIIQNNRTSFDFQVKNF